MCFGHRPLLTGALPIHLEGNGVTLLCPCSYVNDVTVMHPFHEMYPLVDLVSLA